MASARAHPHLCLHASTVIRQRSSRMVSLNRGKHAGALIYALIYLPSGRMENLHTQRCSQVSDPSHSSASKFRSFELVFCDFRHSKQAPKSCHKMLTALQSARQSPRCPARGRRWQRWRESSPNGMHSCDDRTLQLSTNMHVNFSPAHRGTLTV